jgi:hypothetical protein
MHCYTIPSVEQQEILTSYPLFRTKIQWIQWIFILIKHG